MKNNKGFSLIELLVAMAIMVIIGALVFIQVGAASGTKIKECTKNIEAVLNKSRVTTMGKDEVVAKLYVGANDNYYMDVTTSINGKKTTETKKVGRGELIVKYSFNDDYSNPQLLTAAKAVSISFDRSSGCLRPDESGNYCQRIWVSNAKESMVRTITIYKETGTVETE